jgi:hypothetical protein
MVFKHIAASERLDAARAAAAYTHLITPAL